MDMAPTPLEWVTIKTTLPKSPYPPIENRQPIKTQRLILKPVHDSQAEVMHKLRLQPEVMKWTVQGKPDVDIAATRKVMALRLPPNDKLNYDWSIFEAATGEFIGIGGSHMRTGELGWPVIGYMLKKEAWGRGYATEFVKGYLENWWQLEREEVELKVEKSSVEGDGEVKREMIVAVTVQDNKASQNVMMKCGFEKVKVWEEEDLHEEGGMINLLGFVAKKPYTTSKIPN